ncbi:MAG TPA: aminopeptidase, partial [Gaiellaceae bacterium]|nr:aminopeptidase [Gaiellaceae bacterium]
MTDPRAARLAELIVGYSLELQPGKILRVDTAEPGIPLAVELYRAALRIGAYPYVQVQLEGLAELLIKEGSGDQFDFVPPAAEAEVDLIDAIVTIWSEVNTRAL